MDTIPEVDRSNPPAGDAAVAVLLDAAATQWLSERPELLVPSEGRVLPGTNSFGKLVFESFARAHELLRAP